MEGVAPGSRNREVCCRPLVCTYFELVKVSRSDGVLSTLYVAHCEAVGTFDVIQ